MGSHAPGASTQALWFSNLVSCGIIWGALLATSCTHRLLTDSACRQPGPQDSGLVTASQGVLCREVWGVTMTSTPLVIQLCNRKVSSSIIRSISGGLNDQKQSIPLASNLTIPRVPPPEPSGIVRAPLFGSASLVVSTTLCKAYQNALSA